MVFLDLLINYKKDKDGVKILILGLDNAGKTTLLKNLSNEDCKTSEPTTGFNVKSINNDNYSLDLWDIGGQKEIRQYWKHYFEKIFVVDSSDEERIKESNTELKLLINDNSLSNVPFLIFANKQDLLGLDVDEIIEKLELNNINNRKWSIYSCSALKEEGISEGMKWIIENLN